MKKQLITLAMLGLFTGAGAQQTLKQLISGPDGTSNHFTRFSQEDQAIFNPRQARDALRLDPSSDLVIQSTETDKLGYTHYRYYQTYKNIPVENSMFIAHLKNGKLSGLSGEIITDFEKAPAARGTASIPAKQAIASAIKYVNAQKYAWQDEDMERTIKQEKNDRNATYYPAAQLVWFSAGERIQSRNLILAYKVDVYASIPLSRAYYFIEAQTGLLLGKKDEIFYTDAVGKANTAYSGSKNIHSDKNGAVYRLRDLTKGDGILTLHGESGISGTDYTSSKASWKLTGTDQAALDAHYGVSQTYAFYMERFNRNSYDNLGTALTSYVNDPMYTDNAYWNGTSMHFCKRSNSASNPGGVTGIDVTGHELTHGVTQKTSALAYTKEPGAMNESMSDIMGKSVQFWSKPADTIWTISNDMNWIIRNMANPNAREQPDTYKGKFWTTGSGDNYGVHTNSGVGNFMFYLLVKGGKGTNDLNNVYTVNGIGLEKADQIIYRTNTTYLTPNSQYADWRQACINAALDLYPGDTAILTSVYNAWYAVGIGRYFGDDSCFKPTGLSATAITDTSATLTWSASDATAYNLLWKAATASGWKKVRNISGNSYSLKGLNPHTAYKFQVQGICGDTTGNYSAAAAFTTADTGAAVTYCASSALITLLGYIDEVDLGAVKNISGDNDGYGDFTSLTAGLTTGASAKIRLSPGFYLAPSVEYWAVYIDYNQDGDFADAGERMVSGSSMDPLSATFTVPTTAKTGSTRMRIQMNYVAPAITDPCLTYFWGEVEDYTVNISAPVTIASLDFTKETPAANVKIRPNPVYGSSATVSYTVAKEGKVTLMIMDMFGRTVQRIDAGNKTAGSYVYNLNNTNKLATGNYILSVLQNNVVAGRTRFIAGK